MGTEQAALQSLAKMRDQKVVFHNVRGIVNGSSSNPAADIEAIRELYDAYDESHPAE